MTANGQLMPLDTAEQVAGNDPDSVDIDDPNDPDSVDIEKPTYVVLQHRDALLTPTFPSMHLYIHNGSRLSMAILFVYL